jgi:demethylmenaquinone methyltransferase/2-methoxy-6-polyprenyl-1,4-benzoquinol methylase
MEQKPHTVDIFTEVAPNYEFLNKVMTAGLDKSWRKTMLSVCESALGRKPHRALDLATGTGDVARMMALAWPNAEVMGSDPTPAMLEAARVKSADPKAPAPQRKIQWQEGVAERIDCEDASFDVVTIAFGFRNVAEALRHKAAEEAFRVLKPGGVFAILELGIPPKGAWQNVYKVLLKHGMPRFASFFAPKDAYEYLARSVVEFPPPDNVRRLLSKAGFLAFAPRPLTTGMTWLYLGKKPIE